MTMIRLWLWYIRCSYTTQVFFLLYIDVCWGFSSFVCTPFQTRLTVPEKAPLQGLSTLNEHWGKPGKRAPRPKMMLLLFDISWLSPCHCFDSDLDARDVSQCCPCLASMYVCQRCTLPCTAELWVVVNGYDKWYYLQVTMSGWKVFIAGNDAATCLSSVLMVVPLHIFAWRLGCPLSSDTETETRVVI